MYIVNLLNYFYFQYRDGLYETFSPETGKTLPLLICATEGEERQGNYLLRVDSNVMEMEHGFLQALETVTKFRLLLHMQLRTELSLFYDFVLGCIMKKKTK